MRWRVWTWLYLLRLGFAQNAVRPDNQQNQQQREGHKIAVGGGEKRGYHNFHRAQNKAADHCAADIADTADHGADKSFPADHDAHVRIDHRISQAVHHTGRAAQARADGKRKRDDFIHRYAHQRDNGLVPGNGAHGHARFGALDNKIQNQHQDQRKDNDENLQRGNGKRTESPGCVFQKRAEYVEDRELSASVKFSRKRPTPRAVIMAETRGALRSGL